MKKVLAFALSATMILSMTSCDSSSKSGKLKGDKKKDSVEIVDDTDKDEDDAKDEDDVKEHNAVVESVIAEIDAQIDVEESEETSEGTDVEPSSKVSETTEETDETIEETTKAEIEIEAEETTVAAEVINYDYEDAYLKFISEFVADTEGDTDRFKYDLIYFDEDDIPELVIDYPGYEVSLFTYADGEVYTLMGRWGYGAGGNHGYTYLPRENSLYNSNSDYAGACLWETYLSADENHELIIRISKNYQMFPEGVDDPWNNIDENTVYYFIEENEVTEEEYISLTVPGVFRNIAGRFTKEELINNYLTTETVPKLSYYYVYMADCTWQEAVELAKAQGGHLATLNDSLDFYYLRRTIEMSNKPNGVYYLGGMYDEECGSYIWVTDDSNDLMTYNYMWKDGEPSLSGSTEDGRTVDEKYIVITTYDTEWGKSSGLLDVPNDVLDAAPTYSGNLGYIVEIER